MNKILFFGAPLLLIIAGGAWYFVLVAAPQVYSAGETPASVLVKQNPDYAAAEKLQREGKHALALQSYQKALAAAKDDFQKSQVLFDIAYETEQLGKYKEAIVQFKAITAEPANYPIVRAAALQNVGLMYYTYSGSTTLQTIVTETFRDSPYSSFRNNGASLDRAYINLFEHAARLYPLALSEIFIAYGYGNELLGMPDATTTPQGREYLGRIMQGLEATRVDLERMRATTEEKALIPEVLVRAGSTIDILATLGVVNGPEQAEPYFSEGVQYAALIGARPGNSYALRYASFVASRYGDARTRDVRNILAPFRIGNERGIETATAEHLRSVRKEELSSAKVQQIAALGKTDEEFKEYLLSLGWQPSDF